MTVNRQARSAAAGEWPRLSRTRWRSSALARRVTKMIQSQTEAKRFFVEKVIQRALAEGMPLSDAERQMLSWSESDPEFIADPQLADQLASEMSDEQYEGKIAGLLRRRFVEDIAVDPEAKGAWQRARSVLEQGDHYIAIIIDRAVGSRLKRWWDIGR